MLAQAVAGAFDLDNDGVVQQAVEKRRGDHGIAEDLAPFGKAAVRGEHHGALFVTGVDELEEEVAAAGHDGQVSDLVDDQKRGTAQIADALAQCALAFGLGEDSDEICERDEVDAFAGADCLDRQCGGEMRFSAAGRSSAILPGFRR